MRKLDVANIRTASPEAVKQINQTVVLNVVRQLQPISRSAVADVSGLHKSTITDIVKDLLADGLLQECGFQDSEGGRRAVLLRLNAGNIRGVVVDVGVHESAIHLGDVTGQTQNQATFPTPRDPEQFLARCTAELDRVFARFPAALFRGIAVSVPGLVDRESGRLRQAPNLGWNDLDLGGPLRERYGLPVHVENEAKLSAIAEMWFGESDTESEANYAFVSVTEGIGVGLVIENQLYRGVNGASGEFGHTTVLVDGPRCGCGKSGCWEALASETAAVSQYVGTAVSPYAGGLDGFSDAAFKEGEPAFSGLLRRVEEGDGKARAALERMGRYLGLGIANLVNGLNLKLVIVGGRVTQAWDLVEPVLAAELRRHALPFSAEGLRVKCSALPEPNVVGALVTAVSSVFSGMTLY
ncbi:MAG: ROK family transcriptional regulator [Methanocella sp.]